MGETARSVLIRPANPDAKPVFLNMQEVQTVVHTPNGPEPVTAETKRFTQVAVLMNGTQFHSRLLGMGWAPGVTIEGGFRVHPALELGAGFDAWPALSGTVTVGDRQSGALRGYESFDAYGGGFYAKAFPFYRRALGRFEPYAIGGFHWNRLAAKGSDDYFSGTSWLAGAGASWRWTRALSFEGRVMYQRITFDAIEFQNGHGDLSGVHQNGVRLSAGVAFRFL